MAVVFLWNYVSAKEMIAVGSGTIYGTELCKTLYCGSTYWFMNLFFWMPLHLFIFLMPHCLLYVQEPPLDLRREVCTTAFFRFFVNSKMKDHELSEIGCHFLDI